MSKKKKKLSRKAPVYFYIFAAIAVLMSFSFILLHSENKSQPCANKYSCISDLRGDYRVDEQRGEFNGQKIDVPKARPAVDYRKVLGESTGEKHIYVDLTHQRLFAWQGNSIIYDFPISSGKWGKTPTGNFKIWIKLKYTRMRGGNKALGTYYDLPNVPYTMFFYNDDVAKATGYSIHGAYWHDNFGQPMSHGCVNLRPEDAEVLYYWADPVPTAATTKVTENMGSTPITIYGKYNG